MRGLAGGGGMVRQEDILSSALKLLEEHPFIHVRDIKEDLGCFEVNLSVKVRQLAKHNFFSVRFGKGNVLIIESLKPRKEIG